jgi:hypothetical protein
MSVSFVSMSSVTWWMPESGTRAKANVKSFVVWVIVSGDSITFGTVQAMKNPTSPDQSNAIPMIVFIFPLYVTGLIISPAAMNSHPAAPRPNTQQSITRQRALQAAGRARNSHPWTSHLEFYRRGRDFYPGRKEIHASGNRQGSGLQEEEDRAALTFS